MGRGRGGCCEFSNWGVWLNRGANAIFIWVQRVIDLLKRQFTDKDPALATNAVESLNRVMYWDETRAVLEGSSLESLVRQDHRVCCLVGRLLGVNGYDCQIGLEDHDWKTTIGRQRLGDYGWDTSVNIAYLGDYNRNGSANI